MTVSRRKPEAKSRAGWEKAFREMSARGDDALLWPDDMSSSFDEDEWEWESEPEPEKEDQRRRSPSSST